MEDFKSVSPLLHLDLNNFNSSEAEDSRYVLTSPRSLESCARLRVKPVDLLFRSLTEFIDEHQDGSLEEVTVLYEQYERGRRERLHLCREERERIIKEGKSRRSSLKPFTALEPVPEQTAESQSTDSKIKCSSESLKTGMSNLTGDRVSCKSVSSVSDGFPSPPAEVRSSTCSGQKFPYSFSLGDLRRSPATEQQLKRLSQDISRKLSITVPEKDRKIAALMLAKHEEEQIRLRQSQMEELHREEEQRQQEERQAQMEQKRRKELLRQIRRWQEDLEVRRRQREEAEAMHAERCERETLQQEERWRRLTEMQKAQRRMKQEAASKEAKERKRLQEKLLKEKEHGEKVQRERELQVAQEKEQQALRSKRKQERRERRRLKVENQRELLRHLLLKTEVEKQERAEIEEKRRDLEQKLQRSKENHALLVEARLQEMKKRAVREDEQMQMAQLRAGQENRDRLQEKLTLVQRCQQRTERAVVQALEQHRSRAQRTRHENQEKELSHRRLRDRVLKEETAQWEQRCKAVAQKEERRETLQKKRVEALERSRKLAHASFYLREKVREQTCRRTFNQMAREAELSAQLGRIKL